MQTSIWVRNLDDRLFEYKNTAEHFLQIGSELPNIDCSELDVVLIHEKNNLWEVVHKSKTTLESELVINQINAILREKNELLQQRKALKKIKEHKSVEGLVDEINQKIRNDYFEVFIKDLISRT